MTVVLCSRLLHATTLREAPEVVHDRLGHPANHENLKRSLSLSLSPSLSSPSFDRFSGLRTAIN